MSVLNADARIGLLAIDADMPRLNGACVGTDPAMWFTDKPQRPRDLPDTVKNYREPKPVRTQRIKIMNQALDLCRDCPVLASCREWTEQHPEMSAYGIWAATTGDERRRVRGAQRRRKAVAV